MRGTSVKVDRGGCGESSRSTALESPTHREAGVVNHHAKSVPAAAPINVTGAPSNTLLPCVREVCGRVAGTVRNPLPSLLLPPPEDR
jgi:alanine dehydrogenase